MSSKNPTPEQQLQKMQEQLLTVFAQNMQQQRLIWQLVSKLGGKVEIDQTDVSPLWGLGFKALSEDGKKIEIRANELSHLSDDQVNKVIEFLRGTTKTVKEAIDNQGLDLYPTHYVQARVAHEIMWLNEKWTDVGQPPDLARN